MYKRHEVPSRVINDPAGGRGDQSIRVSYHTLTPSLHAHDALPRTDTEMSGLAFAATPAALAYRVQWPRGLAARNDELRGA